MNSRFHYALVSHRRNVPKVHEFGYRVPVFVFDLAELESGALDGPLFGRRVNPGSAAAPGTRLPRLLSVHEADHLDRGNDGLRAKLGRALELGGLAPDLATGPVRLVTSARFLGRVFNPVSFWLIPTDNNEGVLAVVTEVNNTFGEKHIYVLGDGTPVPFPASFHAVKEFHVSPFNDMAGEYTFTFADLDCGLDFRIDLIREGRPLLEATMRSDQDGVPVATRHLAGYLLRPQGALTYPRILRQAASLALKNKLPVHQRPIPRSPLTIRKYDHAARGPLERLARRVFLRMLARLHFGRLELVEADGARTVFTGSESGPDATIRVVDSRFYGALARSGDIGFGEAYSRGWWETADLPDLLRLLALNHNALKMAEALGVPGAFIDLGRGLRKLGGRRNDPSGAKENIHAHYDLGDELFATFLDSTMAYSCACFEREDMSLEEAQLAKYQRFVDRLGLGPEDRVLEIGCGWGGFAIYAARHTGCRVDGLTISENQLAFARQRVSELGLDHLVSFRLQDYRDADGSYDKIVSIEMLEAVGHAYHSDFFAAVERLLSTGGMAMLQFIAIHDQRYDDYRFQGDWTRKHIFPGGLLPSLTRVMEMVRDHTRLTARRLYSLAPDYVRTLASWRQRFLAHENELEKLGYDAAFRRTWDYYFSYCMAGFSMHLIDNYHLLLARPEGILAPH